MKILFLVGSLTIGAALALGLTDAAFFARAAFGGVVTVSGVLYIVYTRTSTRTAPSRVTYIADKESDYSETDVQEIFRALSEAKANSTTPFHSASTVSRRK